MVIDPVAPGTYPSRVVAVIDLGLQTQRPYKGEAKSPAYCFATIYELVDEFLKDEDGNDIEDKPRWQSEIMPLHSLNSERAKSTKRYKALDPDVVYEGDWTKLIDQPCLVTIVHNPKPDGKVYTNIENTALMREKDAKRCAALVNEAIIFDLDSPDMEAFERIPAWIKKMITDNLEFKGSKLAQLLEHAPKKEEKAPAVAEEDDENPY